MFTDIRVKTPPSVEPISHLELERHLMINGGFDVFPPFAPSVALSNVAGNVDNGEHRYRVTFVTNEGETAGGDVSSSITVTDKSVSGIVELSNIQLGDSSVISRNIYRTKVGESVFYLVGSIANNVDLTFTDNVADADLGVGCPASTTIKDSLLTTFITSAREMCEHLIGRQIITQTIEVRFNGFDSDYLELPPCQSVTQIKYLDTNGVWQVLDSAEYTVEKLAVTEIYPVSSFPSTNTRQNNVVVEIVVGYGDNSSDVPACLRQWMLFMANTMWTTRHQFDLSTGRAAMTQVPRAEYIDRALDREKVIYTKVNAI